MNWITKLERKYGRFCIPILIKDRWLRRQFQGYGVSIYRHDLERLIAQGDVLALPGDLPGLYAQNGDLLYDPTLGVNVDGAPGDPGRLVF